MTIEEKEIGLGLELEEGVFENTGLTEDGVLVLLGTDGEFPTETNEAKQYRESIESGNRIDLINIDNTVSWSGSAGVNGLFDGTTANNVYFASQNITGKYIGLGFQQDIKITGLIWKQTTNTNQGNWELQMFVGENWKTVSAFNFNTTLLDIDFSNSGYSQQYRIIGISGNSSTSGYVHEIEFKTEPVIDTEVITEGYWESEVIDLKHKFKEFKKVSLTSIVPDSAQVGIEVRMSDSGSNFTPYQQTAEDGTFQSPSRRYIQVKINLYAGYTALNNIIGFKEKESLEEIQKSYYFESTEDGLKINSNETIAIPMELDEEYTGEGYVYVAELDKDEFITETITKLDIL